MKKKSSWPKSEAYVSRFRVPDLIPPQTEIHELKAIFIGESPHRDEVLSEDPGERSPFRGVAGREWWSELSRFMKKPSSMRPVPPRNELLHIVSELKISVMNAVQYPIDPKIILHQGASSEPKAQLGFEKASGGSGYKAIYKVKGESNAVEAAIEDLADRLSRLQTASAQVVCLGNDSRFFVERAFERLSANAPLRQKPLITVPHPSSWWRNASYRARAVQVLENLLEKKKSIRSVSKQAA